MPGNYTFRKKERLKSNIKIQSLLSGGHSLSSFPIKIFWETVSDKQNIPIQVAVSVPKKKFRRAIDRNLLKRRIREAYRLNKALICDPLAERDLGLRMIILYLSDEFISFERLETSMRDLFRKISANLP